MAYVIRVGDIILFEGKLYSVYKTEGSSVKLLPVKKDRRGYVLDGNARLVSAVDLVQKAVYKDRIN